MKNLLFTLVLSVVVLAVQAQTKSKVTNCSAYGAKDGAIDLIVSGGKAPYAFKWSNGATTEDLTGLASGRYTVTITDGSSRGCKVEMSFDVAQPMKTSSATNPLSDNIYTSRFDVYPNPTESTANISFYNSDKSGFEIRVLNTSGAVIYDEKVKDLEGEYNHLMDFSGMSKGIYLVEIVSQKESVTRQLIVQ